MATTGISLVREQTEAMRLPRFLWVPFELGRPFGAPNEPDFQRRVLGEALALIDRTDGPVVLVDFPDDAPAGDDDEIPWVCPVTYTPVVVDEPELVSAVRAEMAQLASWAQLAPAPAANTGLPLGEMVDRLAALVASPGEATGGGGPIGEETVDVEATRLMADDLRTWYLHAVAQQPGRASSHDRSDWFWRSTALAHLLGHVAAALVDHPDRRVRVFAERGVVPRDHWDHVVPTDPGADGEG